MFSVLSGDRRATSTQLHHYFLCTLDGSGPPGHYHHSTPHPGPTPVLSPPVPPVPSDVPVISPVSGLTLIQLGFCVSENFSGSIFQNLVPGFGLAPSRLLEVADGTDGFHLITIRLARGRARNRGAVNDRPRRFDIIRIAASFAIYVHGH